MSDTIKVGIVGAGGNTVLKHIPLLQKIDGVEIVSVANRSIKSSSAVASQFEIKNYYDNWHEVVYDNGLDAVVIGTWPYMHKKLTIEALQSGKHVLCEARMCMNAEEAMEMVSDIHDSSILILSGKGNNGGDGFSAATVLFENNYNIKIHSLYNNSLIKGE